MTFSLCIHVFFAIYWCILTFPLWAVWRQRYPQCWVGEWRVGVEVLPRQRFCPEDPSHLDPQHTLCPVRHLLLHPVGNIKLLTRELKYKVASNTISWLPKTITMINSLLCLSNHQNLCSTQDTPMRKLGTQVTHSYVLLSNLMTAKCAFCTVKWTAKLNSMQK